MMVQVGGQQGAIDGSSGRITELQRVRPGMEFVKINAVMR